MLHTGILIFWKFCPEITRVRVHPGDTLTSLVSLRCFCAVNHRGVQTPWLALTQLNLLFLPPSHPAWPGVQGSKASFPLTLPGALPWRLIYSWKMNVCGHVHQKEEQIFCFFFFFFPGNLLSITLHSCSCPWGAVLIQGNTMYCAPHPGEQLVHQLSLHLCTQSASTYSFRVVHIFFKLLLPAVHY